VPVLFWKRLGFMKSGEKRERRELSKHLGIREFQNIHEGSKCFIIGAGPSLRDVDLSLIKNEITISVNSSILKTSWGVTGDERRRFWISCDILCMEWDYFWKKVIRTECTRIVRNSWARNEKQFKGIDFRYYKPRRTRELPFANEPDCLLGTSSIVSSVDFAILLGCSSIYLVGVDHKMKDGNSHFWQFLPQKDRPTRKNKPSNFRPNLRQQSRVFDSNIRSFKVLKMYGKKKGVRIMNCSSRTAIDVFKKIPFEDAIK